MVRIGTREERLARGSPQVVRQSRPAQLGRIHGLAKRLLAAIARGADPWRESERARMTNA